MAAQRLGFCFVHKPSRPACWLHATAPQVLCLPVLCLLCAGASCLSHLHPLQVMCIAAIIMMALVAAACILPETVVAIYTKVCQMQDKRRRARAKRER